MVSQHLLKRFGDAVQVEYVDLAKDSARQYAAVAESIATRGMPLPVVAVDGVLKMAGYVDFWAISDIIEAKKEGPAQSQSQLD